MAARTIASDARDATGLSRGILCPTTRPCVAATVNLHPSKLVASSAFSRSIWCACRKTAFDLAHSRRGDAGRSAFSGASGILDLSQVTTKETRI